ncbi:molybdate ABC transporter permease subunit [Aquimarina sp. ERC-38]|uniref:molybdate ABC transporter permease subunit n=1 Tax=Aquimarina sp. ERC-38 TaxID=2949996 RepID=UPI00224670E9|nr:molybdate ABC transporter permease subunit [Aquimarina sp. ERC-38]UZO81148.1 molybdate ABC transporter permease subunit [Aquimarina sp. ERC-38]
MDWTPIVLTFKLAVLTTAILLVIAVPFSYWLAINNSRLKVVISALVSMPLVLPPTVLGFYLLLLLSPESLPGKWYLNLTNQSLVFSFTGLLIGSVIYSLPFMINPIRSGFASLPRELSEAAYVLGKSKFNVIIKVLLPAIKPALLTGIILTFAHTLGEFGVVLMIGGSIPNETRVVSIAIYDLVETLQYEQAHIYSLFLFGVSFIILLAVQGVNSGFLKRFWR